jgi:hypothetical protein
MSKEGCKEGRGEVKAKANKNQHNTAKNGVMMRKSKLVKSILHTNVCGCVWILDSFASCRYNM